MSTAGIASVQKTMDRQGRAAPARMQQTRSQNRSFDPSPAIPRQACACGGGCPRCKRKAVGEKAQADLEPGESDDAFENRMDHPADATIAAAGHGNPPANPGDKGQAPGPRSGEAVRADTMPRAVSHTPVAEVRLRTAMPMAHRRCGCGGGCPRCKTRQRNEQIQAKLEVGEADDAYEQEAERVADAVIAAAGSEGPPMGGDGDDSASDGTHMHAVLPYPLREPAGPVRLRTQAAVAHRRCACGGSCSRCKEQDEQRRAQRKPAARTTHEPDQTAVSPQSLGPGRALDPTTREWMEARFGVGFDQVRIHADAQAAQAASAVDAHAYTVGRDIVFNQGRYDPVSATGRHLLAHELTHVVQQGAAGPSAVRTSVPMRAQRQVATDGESGPQCPRTPTGLGFRAPDPSCPRASHAGTTELARWHFCLDSDQPVPGESLAQIPSLIAGHPAKTRYLVHGNASTEGEASYNLALACHRANVVGDAVSSALRAKLAPTLPASDHLEPTIQDRLEVATRGETGEFGPDLASNRIVVLYAEIPGGALPEEPSCEDAPKHLGDIKPEVQCDVPSVKLEGRGSDRHLAHFRFCRDSDVLIDSGPEAIGQFAAGQAAAATYVIHGFASTEGDAAYNKRLSCHRAMRIARELMNAGVRSEQIREVAGVGETDAYTFGDPEMAETNRVALVLAENGEIAPLDDPKRPAQANDEKRAIVDAARGRILAGQYAAEADFYISRWTCGKVPTVRQAVERLTIELPGDQKNERLRRQANGIEESADLGASRVQLSNTALRADNPVECVMERLIDMSFHHAVISDPDLPPDLTAPAPRPNSEDPNPPPTPRHLAGLHLISLAGLSACRGAKADPGMAHGKDPTGIDPPLAADPRASRPLPLCARAPQPTRLLPPTPGDKGRTGPDFTHTYDPGLRNGGLTKLQASAENEQLLVAPSIVATSGNTAEPTASIGMLGDTKTFGDYEIGFMQTVLDDLFIAEYVTGHLVVQKLPVPIRAAHLRGDPPAPSPWMGTTGMAHGTLDGSMNVSGNWRLHTDFALLMNLFRPGLRDTRIFLDTWQRHTRIGQWLVARRRGAPLDRFSTFFIDGSEYEVDQSLRVELQRIRGDMMRPEIDPEELSERENFFVTGSFRTRPVSDEAPDPRLAQFDTPVASDIDVLRQFERIVEPPAASAANGMTLSEYLGVVREILDNLVVRTPQQIEERKPGTKTPRLGFESARLGISIRIDPATGRLLPYINAESADNPVQIDSPELGSRARYHLARALALRLGKRDFLKQGRAAILAAPPANGLVTTVLEPLKQDPDLFADPVVRREMAEMWACSMVTRNAAEFLNPKEFGLTFSMDRDGNRVRIPDGTAYFVSNTADDSHIKMNMICGGGDLQALGTMHTHPVDDGASAGPSVPADTDIVKSGGCGRQHYIISDEHIVLYRPDGSMKDLGSRETLLPKGVKCNQEIPPEIEEF